MTSIFAANETTFATVDEAVATDAFPDYLTRMAEDLAELKAGLHAMLDVGPGERVIDVGCGTGADVRALAALVGPDGTVDGVDNSQRLVDEARLQTPLTGDGIRFHTGDAHDLPFTDAAFDAARAERVLMHLAEPARAVRELVRVTKPGGRVLIADPDHGMWALDLGDRALTRKLMAWWFDFIANPWVARSGPALAAAAGLTDVRTRLFPIVFQDLSAADSMTGLTKIAGAASAQGVVTADEAAAFGDALAARQAERSFFMCGAVIATVGRVPL
jgi:ubiquinone/menaquinone biosynthesis C-methylase UbiE